MLDPHVALSKIIRDVTGFAFAQAANAIDGTPPIDFLRNGPGPNEEGEDPPGIAPGLDGEGVMNLLFCLLAISMKSAQQGFILSSDGVPPPEEWDGPFPPPIAPDSPLFLGDGFLGAPGAVLIGNPLVGSDSGTIYNPFAGPPGSEEQAEQGSPVLKYQDGDKDPRDPRNTIPPEIMENFYPRITIEGVDFTGTFLGLLMLPPGPFGIIYLLLMLLKNELEDALPPDDNSGVQNVSGGESSNEC